MPHGRIALALLVTLVWQPTQAAPPQPASIPPHRAEYLLTRDGLPFGVMTMELTVAADGGYRYLASTEPHAALALVRQALELGDDPSQTEESSGRLIEGRFRPDTYKFRRQGGETVRALDLRFDWEQGRAFMESEDKPWSMPVPAETQDKLSVLLTLRQELGQSQGEHSYSVADGGRLKTYSFRVLGMESLLGPWGESDTLALERSKDERGTDYRLWLDPTRYLLPVRVERDEGGSLYVMELIRTQADGFPQKTDGANPTP